MAGNSAVEAGRAMISVRVKENVREGLQAAAQKLDEFADRTKKTTATVTETSRQITQGMSSRLASLGGGFEAVGLRIGLIGAGLTGAAASVLVPLKSMVTGFAQTGNVIQKFAARTGTSAEAISRLTYAAELSGASATELQNQFRRMQDVITTATTNPNMQAGFARIGLNLQALAGMKPEEQFRTIAEAISRIQDPALKTAAAVDIFGEGANRLLPLLNEGAAGIDRMSAEADKLGLTMSQDAANSAAARRARLEYLRS